MAKIESNRAFRLVLVAGKDTPRELTPAEAVALMCQILKAVKPE